MNCACSLKNGSAKEAYRRRPSTFNNSFEKIATALPRRSLNSACSKAFRAAIPW